LDKVITALTHLKKNFTGEQFIHEIPGERRMIFTIKEFVYDYTLELHFIDVGIEVVWPETYYFEENEDGEVTMSGTMDKLIKCGLLDELFIERCAEWAVKDRFTNFIINYFRLYPVWSYHVINLP
jgi:hypothetical protein